MSSLLRQVFIIFWKDLVSEFRESHHFFSILLFGILLLLLFSFALSVDPDLMKKMASGIFWLTILFSSILSLDHSFRKETEEGQWEGLLLMGTDPKSFYLGKLLANLVFVTLMQIILLPLMAILYDLSLTPSLFVVLFLGSLGIATLGTFYAGLTATFREGQLLLPILLFPMLVPVLLSAVKVTELILVQDLFGQQVAWMKLLILFDTIFLVGSLLFSETLFEAL
jgi:heme exporter protein B